MPEENLEVEETQEVAEVTEETQEVESEQPEATEEDSKQKYQTKVDKRFAKLTADRYAERDARIAAEARLKALEEQLQYSKPQANQIDVNGKPTKDNFEYDEDYYEALTDWKVDQKLEAQNKRQAEQTKKQTEAQKAQEIQNTFLAEGKKVIEKYADYAVITEDLDIPLESELAQEIMECGGMGTEIMYFLGKNPDEEDRLKSLKGGRLAREIGKLEAKLATPIKKKTTKAPVPPDYSRGSKKNTGKVNLNDTSVEDFYKQRYG